MNVSIKVPGSKSYTNRALILAAMRDGETRLRGTLRSDDTERMIECLIDLGITIREENEGDDLVVTGGTFVQPDKELFCGNAGTCLRFLTAVLAVKGIEATLTGDERMCQRPIQDLVDALNQLGAEIETTNGFPPLYIRGQADAHGSCSIRGKVSSQFISAIMMAAPSVDLSIEGAVSSQPYINMTRYLMNTFSDDVQIEGDASAATYFFALGKLLNKNIVVENIPEDSLQGDAAFRNLISNFKPGEVDMNSMPDSVPTLAVFAAFQKGTTTITNVPNLRVKECDRISALATELGKMGCHVEELEDGLVIHGDPETLHAAEIETYNDHRIAMSFALAKAIIPDVEILNPGCVSKTYPDFWEDFEQVIHS